MLSICGIQWQNGYELLKKNMHEKYSQVFEVWEIFKGFWVNVGQTFGITYLSEKTDKTKMY